jgi:hypothetical protein
MCAASRPSTGNGQTLAVLELSELAASTGSIKAFVDAVPSQIASLTTAPTASLYVSDSRLPDVYYASAGLTPDQNTQVQTLCASQLEVSGSQSTRSTQPDMTLYPLRRNGDCIGVLALGDTGLGDALDDNLWQSVLRVVAHTVDGLADRAAQAQENTRLNTYLTVSSMLAQSMGLHDILEVALYSCMEVASAEAASVLLLDDEGGTFIFYHVEGPVSPLLLTMTFPSDQGIAGAVLKSQQAEIVNDAASDERVYRDVDRESGFLTRNLVALPLTAGSEPVGVLEVLNKNDGADFTVSDQMLLMLIAEEIAYAIRNAKIFEYVVNSYCKQRQGLNSCRGCERPLGAWTPCVRYREAEI